MSNLVTSDGYSIMHDMEHSSIIINLPLSKYHKDAISDADALMILGVVKYIFQNSK